MQVVLLVAINDAFNIVAEKPWACLYDEGKAGAEITELLLGAE